MHSAIKTGLLSFGTSGTLFHAPFLDAHPSFNLVAVVERSGKRHINSSQTLEVWGNRGYS